MSQFWRQVTVPITTFSANEADKTCETQVIRYWNQAAMLGIYLPETGNTRLSVQAPLVVLYLLSAKRRRYFYGKQCNENHIEGL